MEEAKMFEERSKRKTTMMTRRKRRRRRKNLTWGKKELTFWEKTGTRFLLRVIEGLFSTPLAVLLPLTGLLAPSLPSPPPSSPLPPSPITPSPSKPCTKAQVTQFTCAVMSRVAAILLYLHVTPSPSTPCTKAQVTQFTCAVMSRVAAILLYLHVRAIAYQRTVLKPIQNEKH